MKSFVGQNSSVFVRSEPYNSAEEKSELFFQNPILHRIRFKCQMSHYHISPFGKRYKSTFWAITFLFGDGHGLMIYQLVQYGICESFNAFLGFELAE